MTTTTTRRPLCAVCTMPQDDAHHRPEYIMDRSPYDVPRHDYAPPADPYRITRGPDYRITLDMSPSTAGTLAYLMGNADAEHRRMAEREHGDEWSRRHFAELAALCADIRDRILDPEPAPAADAADPDICYGIHNFVDGTCTECHEEEITAHRLDCDLGDDCTCGADR